VKELPAPTEQEPGWCHFWSECGGKNKNPCHCQELGPGHPACIASHCIDWAIPASPVWQALHFSSSVLLYHVNILTTWHSILKDYVKITFKTTQQIYSPTTLMFISPPPPKKKKNVLSHSKSCLTFCRRNVICIIYGNSPYRAVSTFHRGYKNQPVNDV
jgi:hypothetical protein